MTKYLFKQNASGSNNGIAVVEYTKGQEVDEKDLSKELVKAWLARKVIEEIKEEDVNNSGDDVNNQDEGENGNPDTEGQEGQEDVDNSGDKEDNSDEANTGDQEVDDFLNGKTDKVPEGTEEITNEEAMLLEIKSILEKNEKEETDYERLREIGIALNIQNMNKVVKPETIVEKIEKYLEELAK